MINPISSTGRAFERSVNYGTRLGLSPEQATDRSSGLLLSPELQKMMQQVQYLQQQRPQMPQGTIAQQLNQLTGISALPMPEFKPRFADGGVVALAAGGPPQMTPEQIRLQQQIREAAERRMGLGSYGIGLENYPSSIEDVPEPERIVNRVVDDKGNIWHKLENGEWRQVSGKRLEGATIQNNRLVYPDRPSPMQREISSYRTGEKRLPPPDVTVDRISGNTVDRRAATSGAGGGGGEGGIRAAAAAEGAPSAGRLAGIRSMAASALPGLIAAQAGSGLVRASSDVLARDEELRKRQGREPSSSFTESMIRKITQGGAEPTERARSGIGALPTGALTPGGMAIPRGVTVPQMVESLGDMGRSFLSGATFGLFGDTEEERAAQRPTPAAAPKPAAPKPAAPKPAGRPAEARMGMFDIPIGIESARAALESAVTEDSEYQKLLKRAQQEGTGPYSKMFTEGDRIKSEQIARLKESKDRGFARSLVAAGLAMAEQASKGGQPGNEAQKFLAAAVAGLGGYAKAQEKLEEEANKSQRELDKFTLDMEQLREASRGELRGSALQRYNQAQARAEKARDNIKAYTIVGAQLEASMAATGMKTAATMAGIQQRSQAALTKQAYANLKNNPIFQTLLLKQQQTNEGTKERTDVDKRIREALQGEVSRIMAIPELAAAVQYETGGAGAAGDVDFSGADDIAKMALGMTGG